jgi:hypothetical protein
MRLVRALLPRAGSMDQSFGTRLRLQRERQQIAIATIAATTKINPSLLRGLERDDLSQWPVGIFRRSYIRAYASAIGLDADAVAREFLELYPDSVEMPAAGFVWPEPVRESDSPTGLGRMVTAAIATVPVFLRRRQKPVSAIESSPPSALEAPPPQPELSVVAQLCTRLARVLTPGEVAPVLAEAARLLDAVGLIVWLSDARATILRPALGHGYSSAVLARMTDVPTDASNAVAASFRSVDVCVVNGEGITGAVVVPLIGPRGCVGVLALELSHGSERRESVRALAIILAAQLARLLGSAALTAAVSG